MASSSSSSNASSYFRPFDHVESGVSIIEQLKASDDDETVFHVPQRYVIQDQFPVSFGTTIPTIDMTKLLLLNQSPNNSELGKLHSACKEWGIFGNTLEIYMMELEKIAMTLLGLLGKLLNLKKEEMEKLFEDGIRTMRMTHYPPCPKAELVIGLKPHSDGSGITILHQVDGVQGLQVKKDGIWFPVRFDHYSVVNIGDILEIMSDGIYKSPEHRVTVNKEKQRISIAMFFLPKGEAEIGPLRSLIHADDDNKRSSSAKIRMEEFMKRYFAHNLNGKTPLERMRSIDG